jgi:superfamily II DNA or RNA helicase
MGLKQLCLSKAYSSDFDDILHDFYIPALEVSSGYHRLAGFFSSTSLAVAAKGVMGLIKNGGNMHMIVSPLLNKEDLQVILDSKQNPVEYLGNKFLDELSDLEDELTWDHISALGWLIANNRLHIKVAMAYTDGGKLMTNDNIYSSGIFHQKVGIIKDAEGNIISFSGSINETAAGWLYNVEEFKVFCNWVEGEKEYVTTDLSKFGRFWSNSSERVKVFDIPQAVKMELIKISPKDIDRIDLEKYYSIKKIKTMKLYEHQLKAVNEWVNNRMMGIFEMATGTGKTFTALGCVAEVLKTGGNIVVCITCPFQHLVQQWKRETEKFGIHFEYLIIADSSNTNWKKSLTEKMIDLSLGYIKRVLVISTHSTFASRDYINIIQKFKSDSKIFLIADEVHGLGAGKRRLGLLEEYDYRLGLSATPKRWFDEIGTKEIISYFRNVVYEFGLEQAISTFNPDTGETYLVPYRYELRFASLSEDELQDYADKTKKIAKLWNDENNEVSKSTYLENLIFERANIIKNAESKFEELEKILDSLEKPIKWTLIYCSPDQIDTIMGLLRKKNIIAHRFTMDEGTTPLDKYRGFSERDYLLDQFAKGKYQALVAMRCLDEGVDIPPARKAILMASSGNQREYIQRIGRVIRRFPAKNEATIFDIIVNPGLNHLSPALINAEKKIRDREMKRYIDISRNAINNAQALALIENMKRNL